MRYVLVFLVYATVLFFDFRAVRGIVDRTERILYLTLGILALLSAIPAAHWMHLDHAGASLSGMLSLFIPR